MAKDLKTSDAKTSAEPDAIVATPLTNEQQVRLECAKLAYRHDRSAKDVVAKAADLERYVLAGQAASGEPEQDGQGQLPLAPV